MVSRYSTQIDMWLVGTQRRLKCGWSDAVDSNSATKHLTSGFSNDFWKVIKALTLTKNSLLLIVGGTSRKSNIANLWKYHFSAIANSFCSTVNVDQVMNALRHVPGHNDINNVN